MAPTPTGGDAPSVEALFDRDSERLRRTVRFRVDRRLFGFADSSAGWKRVHEGHPVAHRHKSSLS
jgi:hypothetical protein